MPKEKPIRVEGIITETLPNVMYRVRLDNGHELIAHVSGKMRMRYIRIVKGDRVSVEMSPYDITKGRIVWLHR
jgi:translation initiation factor IF-1